MVSQKYQVCQKQKARDALLRPMVIPQPPNGGTVVVAESPGSRCNS